MNPFGVDYLINRRFITGFLVSLLVLIGLVWRGSRTAGSAIFRGLSTTSGAACCGFSSAGDTTCCYHEGRP